MKRILCFALLLCCIVPLLMMPTGAAKVTTDRALNQDWILDSMGDDPDDAEAFRLAPYYRMMYSFDHDTGVLDIYCGQNEEGETVYEKMLPYAKMTWVPWNTNGIKNNIKVARLADGVQSLGRYAFVECKQLEELYLPHSIYKINRTAVYNCKNLKTIYYAGNKEDFFYNIIYDEVRNGIVDDSTGELVLDMRDLIHYGESVGVICKNQDGDVIKTYTVGGYFVGDSYKIVPEQIEGLTYIGKESEITGKFKENDDTVYELVYHCEHDYKVMNPAVPCGSFCAKCGKSNPDPAVPHTWGAREVVSERSLFKPLDATTTCTVCNAKRTEYKQPIVVYVAPVVLGVLVITGVVLAIVLPLRHRKKMKEMTW